MFLVTGAIAGGKTSCDRFTAVSKPAAGAASQGAQMHRLSYHSHALAASPATLDAIYAEAIAFNASAGITGALLYLDGRWAQILESGHAAITGLYDRITRDARHDHVTLDYLIETEGRLFPWWSMGRITDDDKADLPLARILAAVTAADADTHIRQLRSLARAARAPLSPSDRETDPGHLRHPAAPARATDPQHQSRLGP
jgi:hypothetical protein